MAIEDEVEIRNLIGKLALYADGDDVDQYITLFTEDAEWEMDMPILKSKLVGIDQIKAGALKRRADGIQGPATHRRHLVMMPAIDVKGDVATGSCYMLSVVDAHKTPIPTELAVYSDEYRKTSRGWKLARRRISRG